MDRQAIDVHGRIPISNAERNCALPKMGSKAPMAEGSVVARNGHLLKNPRALSAGSSKDLDALLVETQHGWHQWRQV